MARTARRTSLEDPGFLESLDAMMAPPEGVEQALWMQGSLSGQIWQGFLQALREDAVAHLQRYRTLGEGGGFCPAAMECFREDRRKIERTYIRQLVALYGHACETYKRLSG